MSNLVSDRSQDATLAEKKRRTTRMFQAVPLNIRGQNKTGNALSESTSALAVNCHGCVYPSRYEYPSGSWVTLHVLSQQLDGPSDAVRAQVKFVRLPRNPRELYQVGVELEVPANIWGIQSPPPDWLRFPGNGTSSGAADASPAFEPDMPRILEHKMDTPREATVTIIEQSPSKSSSEEQRAAQVFSSDLLQHALEGMLQQAAAKAVESALSSRLNAVVDRAAKAIENFSQATARRVEEHCAGTREKFEASVRQDVVARMQSDIAAAEQQLRKQIDSSLAEAAHAAQLLEKAATQIPLRLTGMESSARELQGRFSAGLRETVDRAVSGFRDETTRVSGEQLAACNEKIAAATAEAGARLQERAAEADARLETAAAGSIARVQAMAQDEIARVTGEFHQRAQSSLASFVAEVRSEWDARQRACQGEVAHLGKQEIEHFRQRLESILNSAMAGAISTANEHSRILFDSLLRGTVEQLQGANGASASR